LRVCEQYEGADAGVFVCLVSRNRTGRPRTARLRVSAPGAYKSPVDVRVIQLAEGPPGAPADVQASDGAYSACVAVTWDAVPGAEGYDVYRSDRDDFATAQWIGASESGAYLDCTAAAPARTGSGCALDKRYAFHYYWVAARSPLGSGEPGPSDRGYRGFPEDPGCDGFEPNGSPGSAGGVVHYAMVDAPLAVRIEGEDAIDPHTAWAEIDGAPVDGALLRWAALSPTGGWVICFPDPAWPCGAVVTVTAGARTESGRAVGPVTREFMVETQAERKERLEEASDGGVDQAGSGGFGGFVPLAALLLGLGRCRASRAKRFEDG
jgi:hypothetical protein